MKGRKSTPTYLKLVTGNPGKRPINRDEPNVPALKEMPAAPAHLNAGARKHWRRLAPQLIEAGLLTGLDLDMLGSLCSSLAMIDAASAAIATEGATIVTVTGQRKVNPWVTIRNVEQRSLAAQASEFGLSPSARSRIKAPPARKADNFGAYMGLKE